MKKNHYLASLILLFSVLNTLYAQTDPGTGHLKHLWMFKGNANDQVGLAHGAVQGGSIEDGVYSTSQEGDHIQLPGHIININQYTEVSFAIWFRTLPNVNTTFHTIWYFGDTISYYDSHLGKDYCYLAPSRMIDNCYLAISCLADDPLSPWSYEDAADRSPTIVDNDSLFFMVGTLTDSTIMLYVGNEATGELEIVKEDLTREENRISNISNKFAYIAKSGYKADPTWQGSVYEMSIYDKALRDDEVLYLFEQGYLTDPPDGISHDATLSDLKSGEVTVPGFNILQYDYTMVLPSGTMEIPEVSATATHDSAEIVITPTSSIPGTTTIEVTAQDDETRNTYSINYTLEDPPSIPVVNNLKHFWTFENNANDDIGDANGTVHGGIFENGAYVISGENDFIQLPGDTINIQEYPEVSVAVWFRGFSDANTYGHPLWYFGTTDSNSTIGIDYFSFHPILFEDSCQLALSCKHDDPEKSWIYEDRIRRKPSMLNNDSLYFVVGSILNGSLALYIGTEEGENIQMITHEIQRSENNIANISNNLAFIGKSGFKAEPAFQCSVYEMGIYDKALTLGEVSILLENGSMASEDTSLATDATLSDLQKQGSTLPDFHPDKLEYTIELSKGTIEVPEITATPNHEHAIVDITPADEIPGTTTIAVMAENGAYLNVYSIHFNELPYVLSDDATLSNLQSNGNDVETFDPDVLEYSIEVSKGMTGVPNVTATPSHDSASVIITPASEIPGTTTIEVTAQDQTTTRTYTINYSLYVPSSDATLSDLKSDGVSVPGFDPQQFGYTVTLSSGIIDIPEVTAITNHDSAQINILSADQIPGSTNVIVIAEDDTSSNHYVINYTIATAIYETSPDGIHIHPNPVKNILYISNIGQADISIYTPEGKLVAQTRLKNQHAAIDVSALENGLYLIEIRENDRRKIGRFIKN